MAEIRRQEETNAADKTITTTEARLSASSTEKATYRGIKYTVNKTI